MADDAQVKISIIAQDLAQEVLKRVSENMKELGVAGTTSSGQLSELGTQFGSMHKVLEELTPKTDSATAAFSSMKGVLGEAFENPTQAVKNLGGALATDLTAGLGAAGVAAGLAAAAIGAVGFAAFELA